MVDPYDPSVPRIGYVDTLSYLEAAAKRIGAFEHPSGIWVLDVSGVLSGASGRVRDFPRYIPVIFEGMEPNNYQKTRPEIKIVHEGNDLETSRLVASELVPVLEQPARDFNLVSYEGQLYPDKVEVRSQEPPHDISLTYRTLASSKIEALVLIELISARIPIQDVIYVDDSEDNVRVYDIVREGGINDLSNVSSPTRRDGSYSLSVKIMGELSQGIRQTEMTVLTGGITDSGSAGDPDPGTDGGYAVGFPYPPAQISGTDEDGDGVDDFTIEIHQFLADC